MDMSPEAMTAARQELVDEVNAAARERQEHGGLMGSETVLLTDTEEGTSEPTDAAWRLARAIRALERFDIVARIAEAKVELVKANDLIAEIYHDTEVARGVDENAVKARQNAEEALARAKQELADAEDTLAKFDAANS